MSAEFPTDLPTFTDPTLSENLSDMCGGLGHVDEIVKLHAEIAAGLTKVGKNSSAVTTSHDYKLSGVTGTDKAVSKTGTETLTNKTLTSPTINTPIITTPTIRNWDGWEDANETWTYASATTITVPTNATTKYYIGDKIRFQNNDSGTYLYAYIITVAATLLTVIGDAVPNATLTDNYYSNTVNPFNFPHWFTYTPTITVAAGTAPTYTNKFISRFNIIGHKLTVHFFWQNSSGGTAGDGTGTLVCTLPVTGVFIDTSNQGYEVIGSGICYEESGTIGNVQVVENSTTTICFKFTNNAFIVGNDQSSSSRIISATFSYEI